MSNALEIVKELWHLLFPLPRLWTANKAVDEKIRYLENGGTSLSYMVGYESLSLDDAKSYLAKTFESRKSLEDKAKANVFGVTIAVSLIVGFSQLFTNTNFNSYGLLFKVVAIVIIACSLVAVSMGTILSILILGKYNRVYDIAPVDCACADERKNIFNIAINTELNSLYNVKRNNILYASYGLIINFLLLISIAFILVISSLRQQDIKTEVLTLQLAIAQNDHKLHQTMDNYSTERQNRILLLRRLEALESKEAAGKKSKKY